MPGEDSSRRRYLLGEASEEECAALERAFMSDPAEEDRMAAAEERLIEDHIDGALDEHERQQFESHYLAAPPHRERLRTTRQLLAAAAHLGKTDAAPPQTRTGARSQSSAWFAAAAALVLIVAGAAWLLEVRDGKPATEVARSAPAPSVTSPAPGAAPGPSDPPTATPAPPRVFAIVLSASAVRSSDAGPAVVIPANVDVVTLKLEADRAPGNVHSLIVVVRRLGGAEIWRGAARADAAHPSGVIVRVEFPASRLPADDYIVELLEGGPGKSPVELDRYFLRIRTR